SAAARKHRRIVSAARLERFENIVDTFRNDDADGHLSVVRPVRRVERAASVVEPDLAADAFPQHGFELTHAAPPREARGTEAPSRRDNFARAPCALPAITGS